MYKITVKHFKITSIAAYRNDWLEEACHVIKTDKMNHLL